MAKILPPTYEETYNKASIGLAELPENVADKSVGLSAVLHNAF
jgi:hypothetical protein